MNPERAMPGRVFLTGASGYVGRNLIRYFVGLGIPVVALARSAQSAQCVRALGAVPFCADMRDPRLAAGMAGCDTLIHAAADTAHGAGSPTQHTVNELGTRNVMMAARAAGIRKAVHISTESVLATGMPLVDVDEAVPFPRKPAGTYSRSKAAAETIALGFSSATFSVTALRPRFVWGRDDSTALPQLVAAVRANKFAWIAGGTYLTDTTHIGNLCEAVLLAIRRGGSGEVYFISDGERGSFRDVVSALLETQGLTVPDKSVPRGVLRVLAGFGDLLGACSRGRIAAPLTLQSYAASAVEVTVNIDKARRELGYDPVISREQGLAEMRAARAQGG